MPKKPQWHEDGFVAEASHYDLDLHRVAGIDSEVADYAESLLAKGDWSSLMAYLYRRFGPPNSGSDDHREIARWRITTPMEGVHVSMFVKPGPLSLIFHVDATRAVIDAYVAKAYERRAEMAQRMHDWSVARFGEPMPGHGMKLKDLYATDPVHYDDIVRRQNERIAEYHREHPDDHGRDREAGDADLVPIAEAARRAVRDLLRTVQVRDHDINALGDVDGTKFPAADHYANAGRWLPSYAYSHGMEPIIDAIEHLGGGREGLARVSEIIRREIPEEGDGAFDQAVALLRRLAEDAPADGNSRPHPSTYWGGIVAIRKLLATLPAEGA